MSAYFKKFCCSLKVNGKILREKDGMVSMPFDSEFSILLKNLESRLAVVKISLDGNDVLDNKALVVQSNSSLELDGFLNGNIAISRFKFIEKTSEIENFRGNRIDDGILRIEWKFQKEKPIIRETIHEDYWKQSYDPYRFYWNPYWYPYYSNTWDATYTMGDDISSGNNFACDNYNCDNTKGSKSMYNYLIKNSVVNDIDNIDGITVHGSEIQQNFTTIFVGNMEEQSHVIILKLTGYHDNKKVEIPVTVKSKIICSICGNVNKSNVRYCNKCGTHL